MKKFTFIFFSFIFFSACLGDKSKKGIGNLMQSGMRMQADEKFKTSLALIELHKIRTGSYPETLEDIGFLTQMDSMSFSFVKYTLLDSTYRLDINFIPGFKGEANNGVGLHYPEGFWKGTGCSQSNTK
ncbi:MAG: hypothetical protein ACJ77K_10215 [Bacteroidia bacterium]